MQNTISYLQAEKRIRNAWNYLMKTEPNGFGSNPRWEKFRMIRDRLRPFRMPLRWRIEQSLCGLAGQSFSKAFPDSVREMKASGIAIGE